MEESNATAASVWSSFIDSIDKVDILSKAISIGITLLVIFILLKVSKAAIRKFFKLRAESRIVGSEKEYKENKTLLHVVDDFVRILIWIVGILVILSYFIDIRAIITVAGVGTVAVGFGAKDLVQDMIGGLIILSDDEFLVGDFITVGGDHYGQVIDIGIRSTTIRQLDGTRYIIRNGQISTVTNHSRENKSVVVHIGIAYEENIDRVLKVLNQVCEEVYQENADLYPVKPKVLGVMSLDASSVDIGISSITRAENALAGQNTLRQRAKEALDREGIEIPYNHLVMLQGEAESEEKA